MIILTEITDRYYYTERLQTDVARKTKKVVAMQRSLIGSFATIIEARDGVTGLHIKNTGNFVKVEQRIPVRISLKGNKPEDLKRLRAGFNVECEVKY